MVLGEMTRCKGEGKGKGKDDKVNEGGVKKVVKEGSGKWYRLTQALSKAILEGRRADAQRIATLIVMD